MNRYENKKSGFMKLNSDLIGLFFPPLVMKNQGLFILFLNYKYGMENHEKNKTPIVTQIPMFFHVPQLRN